MTKTALVVDDNRALAENLAEILGLEGYQVVVFDDPVRAAQQVTGRFDVALLDLRMPGLDGLALQQRLARAQRAVHFVLMTADAHDERLAWARSEGVDGILLKPVQVPQLLAILKELERA